MTHNVLIPNSSQLPNFYVDQLLHLLTCEETKVLLYMVRHIFGWNENRVTHKDHISLSQFVHGYTRVDGTQGDYGTNLHRTTVIKCLQSLAKYGIAIAVGEVNQKGQQWQLQIDASKVDMAGLQRRLEESKPKRKRTPPKQVVHAVDQSGGTPDVPDNQYTPCTSGTRGRPDPVHAVDQQVVHAVDTQNPCINLYKHDSVTPSADTPPDTTSKTKKSETKQPTPHQELMTAYQDLLGYQIPNGGKEGAAAKKLLAAGYTITDIQRCYEHLKRQPFYQDKHLSLHIIHENIGAFLSAAKDIPHGRQQSQRQPDAHHTTRPTHEYSSYANEQRTLERVRQIIESGRLDDYRAGRVSSL